jgi:hypothetical protein
MSSALLTFVNAKEGGTAWQATQDTSSCDTTAPTLAEVTPVPTPTKNTTPSYTFSSNEAGTISYS